MTGRSQTAHAAEAPVAFHHMRRLVEDVDALEARALAHREVVGVVRRCGLHRTRAEAAIHVEIGEDGYLAPHDGKVDRLAHEVLVALVFRVHGNARVAEHRLRARGGHH